MSQRNSDGDGTLHRDLGLIDAIAVGWGAIMGAGIFVVTGVAAQVAGPGLLVGLAIAAGAAVCNALSSAQLAARYPRSGGTYEYGYELLDPRAGFAAGWMFLASKLAAGGTVALGFGEYLARLIPSIPPKGAAIGAVLVLTLANWMGIKKAGRLNLLIVSITLATLIFFVVAGLPSVRREHFTPLVPNGWESIFRSASLLFFAYTGYARIATLAEEVRDPARTIPRAIVISLGTAALLYFAVAAVAVGVSGASMLAASKSPLAATAGLLPVSGAPLAVGVGATTAMLGVLLSQILGISRVMLAMARRGDFPGFFSHVAPSTGVPSRAIGLTSAVILGVALVGTLPDIVRTATFTILLYYAITNVAALRLEPGANRLPKWIPALGLAICLLLALSLEAKTIGAGIALLAVGFLLRSAYRWRFPAPTG